MHDKQCSLCLLSHYILIGVPPDFRNITVETFQPDKDCRQVSAFARIACWGMEYGNFKYFLHFVFIKTHSSESQGQENMKQACKNKKRNHYCESKSKCFHNMTSLL